MLWNGPLGGLGKAKCDARRGGGGTSSVKGNEHQRNTSGKDTEENAPYISVDQGGVLPRSFCSSVAKAPGEYLRD